MFWQNPQISKFVTPHKNIAVNWKLHFWLFLLSRTQYQNEIWSNIRVPYEKHFLHVFELVENLKQA